jgi:molybdopterin/thiamine biosynthesis adenylyltransferase
VNDACVLTGKPNVYGSIFRFEGQASVFATEDGPCYRCLYPEPPPPGLVPSCAEGGVLGILPGLVGVMQATEVIKLILGYRRAADRAAAADRRAGHEVPRTQAAQESRLPGLRHASHGDEADRLQRVLRHSRGGKTGGQQEFRKFK